MTRSYKEAWDGYWREVTPRPGVAFWDSPPDRAVQRELPVFSGAFDRQLPVIEVIEVPCDYFLFQRAL
jgi:hypothetical protein